MIALHQLGSLQSLAALLQLRLEQSMICWAESCQTDLGGSVRRLIGGGSEREGGSAFKSQCVHVDGSAAGGTRTHAPSQGGNNERLHKGYKGFLSCVCPAIVTQAEQCTRSLLLLWLSKSAPV